MVISGKSLDRIMKLKEIAGERDMFDVLKKQEKKMKKENEKRIKAFNKPAKANVFDFINKKLGGKKGKLFLIYFMIWAVHMHCRPRSACLSIQSDQGLHCPQTESLETIECYNGFQMPR